MALLLPLTQAATYSAPPPASFGPITMLGGLKPLEPQFSGYASVSATTALFYHLVQSNNKSAPLLIWTNGGPGASSVEFGDFFQLIGPWQVNEATGSISHNPLSWATKFSLIFIDHPAPTGLSFSSAPPTNQSQNAVQYVAALQIILARHEMAAKNVDIFMGGESYAGRFIPAIATHILAAGMPLKGVLIGNGEVDPTSAFASYGDWLFNLGYIQETQQSQLREIGINCTALAENGSLAAATAVCYSIRTLAGEWGAKGWWDYDIRYAGSGPYTKLQRATVDFLDREQTRSELHAMPTTRVKSISQGGKVAWASFNSSYDFVKSGMPELLGLLKRIRLV
jgi:hypothetical protein